MQQGGGSPYGAPPPPEQLPFPGGARVAIPGPDHIRPAEPASPISSRPPSLTSPASASASASAMANFDDPAPSAAHGNFPDDDFGERVAATGSRWPRQETLALLKIRSDMDAAFRDATLKAPLWEEISRKLAELGYRRNAKKCKEKFENVHKYYKRTKEGRAGRQDGKSYRFFDQLEALHGANATSSASIAPVPAPIPVVTAPAATPNPLPGLMEPSGVAASTSAPAQLATVPLLPIMPPAGISFSSNTSSSSASESEDTEGGEGRKRKRKRGGGGGASRKMLAFFEGLMRQVIERQEAMQQRLMEAIEKREQDRMVREEAWRRQEMARLAREHELLAQERAAAASRDAAVITFLQTLTGQSIQLPPPLCTAVRAPSPAPPPPPPPPPPQPQQVQTQQPQQPQQHPSQPPQQQTSSSTEIVRHYQPPASTELVPVPETQETPRGMSFEPASSRWPKVEVHALISLRSSLDSRYQEPGPKAPLWEEISSEMRRLGYNRSAKRCKEKWENINKYFKKVKESNKRRPEDAKTCPYFHQLDALYRQKLLANTRPQEINPSPQETTAALAILAPPPQVRHPETENKNGSGGSAFEEGTSSTDATMKPEDFVKELMKSTQQKEVMDDYDKLEELESEDDDVDDEEDEGEKMQYRVQFQRPNQSGGAAPATGSFLAMV